MLRLIIAASIALAGLSPSAAAESDRRAVAARRSAAVRIDGRLDERAWADAPAHGDFWQRDPKEGVAPRHRTEFRVLYDDDAIYIGVRAHDDRGDQIRALLHRRDQDSAADWVGVWIDSYHDRRTAFGFAINAANVQQDLLMYNDTAEDRSWDAVWTSATSIDGDGWSAEVRIPFGQLRFPTRANHQWGIQVMRYVGRDGEQTFWSPSPRNSTGFVSNFGVLDGLAGLAASRRLEALPYVTAGLHRVADAHTDPFHDAADPRAGFGIDVRYGLGSAATLTATINPDFGQVEADPSQVNLSANETYFAEKRPFFLEGTEIFQFGIGQGDGGGSSDTLFYSRRIGASPHGSLDGEWVDAPTGTTIYGAAKVSAKTDGGWSYGVLEAVTAEEEGTASLGGVHTRGVVEPLTSYGFATLRKDLREGKTALASAVTHVVRDLDGTGLEDELHDQAFTGGAAVDHKWGEDDGWNVSARLTGTYVHGSEEVLLTTQKKHAHLFQRPDATHVELDPTRTSLGGWGFVWSVGGRSGKHYRFSTGGDLRSPGFEANDLGFHTGADGIVQWLWAQYRDDEAGDLVNTWSSNLNAWIYGSHQPELHGYGGNVNLNATFGNFWFLGGGVNVERPLLDVGALRGGPALKSDPSVNGWLNVGSDGRKAVSFSGGANLWRNPSSDSFSGGVFGGVSIQARSNVELFLGPSYSKRSDHQQYVTEVADDAGMPHYVFAHIVQHTLGLTIRAAWTFTPDLSLQVYAQPFVASGAYDELKQAADTRAARWEDRFSVFRPTRIDRMDDAYVVDEDGDGATDFSFGVPDFNFRELRSNVVLRWQYRPGSTVYFIWSHGRADAVADGDLQLGRDLRGLSSAPGEHVVMVKANYWFGL